MLPAIAVLLLCQLAGESLVRATGIPVPGPVIGIMILIAGVAIRQRVSASHDLAGAAGPVAPLADGLLRNLSLLFVPAGCGIAERLAEVGPHVPLLLLILVISTVLALVATVTTFIAVRRLTGGG